MVPSRFKHRAGHTLVELVVAMASATVLLGGLASTIFIASQALDTDASAPVQTAEAAETSGDLMADVQDALSFSERTDNAVTFQVPDRDGDGLPETIRYAWSGTAGDPLTVQVNGGATATLADKVEQFDLNYSLRSVTGTGFAKGVIEDDGLVAHWRFDEGSGREALDSTPNENHGKLIGPTWMISKWGPALEFDGKNDHVTVAHNDVLSLGDELTITAWIMGSGFRSQGYDTVVFKGTKHNTANYFLDVCNGKITFGFYNYGWHEFYSPSPLFTGRLYHIAATVEPHGSNLMIRLYQDGVEVLAQQSYSKLIINTQNLTIGKSPYREYWSGILDDVRIYNRALSGEEIMEVRKENLPAIERIPIEPVP